MKTGTVVLFFSQVIEALDNGYEARHNLREESHAKDHHEDCENLLNVWNGNQVSIPNDCKRCDYVIADTDEAAKNVRVILKIVGLIDECSATLHGWICIQGGTHYIVTTAKEVDDCDSSDHKGEDFKDMSHYECYHNSSSSSVILIVPLDYWFERFEVHKLNKSVDLKETKQSKQRGVVIASH